MSLGTGTFEGPYSYRSRFESGDGTNPEELIAAAHAGCFSMALSGQLSQVGITPNSIETSAAVHLVPPNGITKIELTTVGDVPGISEADFIAAAQKAKETCPVSQALAAVEITLTAKLAS
jgi:osmotically inducible protein OsmC